MLFELFRRQMKGIFIVTALAFVVSLLYVGGVSFFGGPREENAGEPVAEVNGEKITYGEFQQAYLSNLQYYQQFSGRLGGSELASIKFGTLQSLIDQRLLVQLAKRERIKVSSRDVEEKLREIRDQFPSRNEYRQQLREQGLTEGRLRELIRQSLLVENLRKEKSKVQVTDEDVRRAYEQVRASHILFKADPNDAKAMNAALQRAQSVLQRIRSGADFAAMARQYSDDPGTKSKGGDLDWFGRDSGFVKEFVDAAFSLPVGQVSAPVKTQFGYHLIKVTGRKEAKGADFEKQKGVLREQLQESRGSAAFREWFTAEQKKAKIIVHDPEMRAIQFVQNGQLAQAVGQYQEALAKEPQNPYLHLMLGRVYEGLKDLDRAIAEYEKAVQVGGDSDPEILMTLGLAYRQKKQTEKAIANFRKASDLDPMNTALHTALMQIYTEMGRKDLVKQEQAKLADIQRMLLERQRALEQQQRQLQQGAAGSGSGSSKTTTTQNQGSAQR